MCKEFPGFVCAVSNKDDFAQELTEYGFDYVAGDKPVVAARDAKGLKYKMEVIIPLIVLYYLVTIAYLSLSLLNICDNLHEI